MDLNEARAIAQDLLDQHGLSATGWTFAWDNAEKRLGVCKYGTKRISMSRKMASAADVDVVTQTMIHEVAHALTPGAKHGPAWKRMAKSIGYLGERTSHNPHADEVAKRALPLWLRDLEPDLHLRSGAQAVIIRGDAKILGQRAIVTRANAKTYSVSTEGRVSLRVPREWVAASPAGAQPMDPSLTRARLRRGEEGVVVGGRNIGTRVIIDAVSRDKYSAVDARGRRWSLPFVMVDAASSSSLVAVGEHAPAAVNRATPSAARLLNVGEVGSIMGGKLNGREARIVKVNRTRYVASIAGAGEYSVPFSMVAMEKK